MKFLDYEGVGHLIKEIKRIFVQKESGKGLSSNDYTNIEKDKLEKIEAGAEKNKVDSVNNKTGKIILTGKDILVDTESNASIFQKIGLITTATDSLERDKVDKIPGKGLSSNDFTNIEKDKLNKIEAGAEKNKIDLIKRNGVNLVVQDKAVDIKVPTKTSELTNNSTFQTEKEVKALIQEQGKIKKKIVDSLPKVSEADDNTLYLIRNKQNTGYEEWMIVEDGWEVLGDTAAVDFTGYLKETDIKTISNAEIDAFLKA